MRHNTVQLLEKLLNVSPLFFKRVFMVGNASATATDKTVSVLACEGIRFEGTIRSVAYN